MHAAARKWRKRVIAYVRKRFFGHKDPTAAEYRAYFKRTARFDRELKLIEGKEKR